MTALYVLANEYRQAAELLADLDMAPEVVRDTLESISGELEAKACNIAMMARNLEATAVAIKEAEASLSKRRKAIEAKADWLRGYILAAMDATGVQKISSPYFVISARDNPASVDVFDASMVPSQFMREPKPPEPDKTKIAEAIKQGQDVPGCKMARGRRLDIR